MKSKQEEEFEELMQEYDNEIEAIAGQAEPEDQYPSPIEDDEASREAEYAATRKKYIVDKAVDNPSHYDFIDTTVEKFIEAGLTHAELMGWFKGNVIKYRLRAGKKNPISAQDIAKADQYQKFYNDYVKRNTP